MQANLRQWQVVSLRAFPLPLPSPSTFLSPLPLALSPSLSARSPFRAGSCSDCGVPRPPHPACPEIRRASGCSRRSMPRGLPCGSKTSSANLHASDRDGHQISMREPAKTARGWWTGVQQAGWAQGRGAERAAHVIFSAPSAQVSLTWGADALALRISRRYAFLGVSTKVLYAGALLVPGPARHGDVWQDCGLCMASCSGLGGAEER